MKAIVYTKYGSPDVLQIKEVDKPAPQDHEVLIKIYATTVSSGDCRMRKADPFLIRFFNGITEPKKVTVLGNDLAGVVETTGKDVKMFKSGDHVFGQSGMGLGTNAEYICLPETGMLALKPVTLSFEEAASIPFGGNTALHFLLKGNMRSRPASLTGRQRVLIYGASGSLGAAAVQLAKYFGAEVTAICTAANFELVKSLGADLVIDYTTEDFSKLGHNYDIVFDTTGKSPFSVCVKSLKKKGIYLRAVHMSLSPIVQGIWTSLTSNKQVIGGVAAELKENLIFLVELIEKGKFKPVIDRIYPFEQISEAHRYVDKGHKKGNVVITVLK